MLATGLPHPARTSLPKGATLLDAVVQVAALASTPGKLDPILDKVRMITARKGVEQLTATDKATLTKAYDELEAYLIEKEPLRAFTRESIRKQLYGALSGNTPGQHRKILAAIWASTIILTAIPIMLPASIIPTELKPVLGPTLFMALLHAGAAWLFWSGLTNFKAEIQQAYKSICTGILIIGLSLLQVPLVNFFGQGGSIWFSYIMASLPITIGLGFIYAGVRRFSRLAEVTTRLTALKTVAVSIAVGTIATAVLPASQPAVPFWVRATALLILVSGVIFSLFSAVIVGRVRGALSAIYRRPMFWLSLELVVSGLTCIQFIILQTIAPAGNFYEASGLSALPLVLSSFLILKAGGTFKRIDPA